MNAFDASDELAKITAKYNNLEKEDGKENDELDVQKYVKKYLAVYSHNLGREWFKNLLKEGPMY